MDMNENLAKIRHERSKKDYPGIKLDEDEYVEMAFNRAKICLKLIIIGTGAGVILILLAILWILTGWEMIDEMGENFLLITFSALLITVLLVGAFALMIYRGNKLFVTNKHVIQPIMNSPVSTSINVNGLEMVEDVSFKQENLWQKLFKFGTLRLSTVGEETTYTFKYSDINPEQLSELIEIVARAKKRGKNKKKEEVGE